MTLLRGNMCTWLGYLAWSSVSRSAGTASMYQSSWPSMVSLTACSGVIPIWRSTSFRWPFGELGDHWWKLGLRTSTICCLGTYVLTMYGPVAIRQRGSVEMSLYGVPAGTANANGIAMMSRKAPSGWVR